MPVVRNEYRLGMPELYMETDQEDPKALLDGVACAGLVGILRQLGDLAEFGAEIFHGLQEQVLITSSRSHKLVERVHNIQSALPPVEKAILGQTSHLHFTYTAGSKWHTRLESEQNHFIYSDLPFCIMDSYVDCYDPPHLHKLDKFDIGGPGSCFRRYSDPTYFKRSSAGPYEAHLQSIPIQKKRDLASLNIKEGVSVSLFQDLPTVHMPENFGIVAEVDCLTSSDPRNELAYTDCIFPPSHSIQSEDNNAKELFSVSNMHDDSYLDSPSLDENFNSSCLAEDSRSKSTYITWDEMLEIIDYTGGPSEPTKIPYTTEKMDTVVIGDMNSEFDHTDFDFHVEQPRSRPVITSPKKLESEDVDRNITNTEAVLREHISTYEPPKPSWSTSGGQTSVSDLVMFWTNGGLSGLEPSKPLESCLPAVAGPDPAQETKSNEIQHPCQQSTINDIQTEPSGSGLIGVQDHDGNASGTELVVPEDDYVNPSRMFKFSNRLLVNRFKKQMSLVGDERFASSVKSDVPGNTSIQKGYESVSGIAVREQFGSGTPCISPSSPPLEHMSISFQPIDGFETSRLKLAFPDGDSYNNNNIESPGLVFPSFQLVPEPAFSLHEFTSNSDDDDDDDNKTFCRSSSYASDDCHSNPSESNSEQWDSSHSPVFKDHELDSVKGSQNEVTDDLKRPTQPAPPLPPIEWRRNTINPFVRMEKEGGLSEALTYALNATHPEPTLPQPYKPAPTGRRR